MGPDHRGMPRSTGRLMGSFQTGAERQAETDSLLADMAVEFPSWDVHQVFGGWEAVPKGTPVERSADLYGLAEKLRGRIGGSIE